MFRPWSHKAKTTLEREKSLHKSNVVYCVINARIQTQLFEAHIVLKCATAIAKRSVELWVEAAKKSVKLWVEAIAQSLMRIKTIHWHRATFLYAHIAGCECQQWWTSLLCRCNPATIKWVTSNKSTWQLCQN